MHVTGSSVVKEAELQREIARYLEDVGRAIRHARELRGWDQGELARRAGISRRNLIRIEAGADCLGSSWARLCIVLDLAPEALGLPGGLLGPVTRNVCKVLGLDLMGRPIEKPKRRR
jgi:DNA-binding XRE family transcriptional regulator